MSDRDRSHWREINDSDPNGKHGPMAVADLARALGRDDKNVHGDIAALSAWMAVERDPDGRVSVLWHELDLRLPLQHRAA